MNLIFFQNCISPHQIPYIKETCKDKRIKKVFLITPRVDYTDRSAMGWDSKNLLLETEIIFLLKPTEEEITALFRNKDCIAFFSGIRADKDIFAWFKLSLSFQIKRGIITEPPNIYPTKPLFLHYIRFLIQDYKFIKYIDYVFAFGDLAVKYYQFWSHSWKVIPFAYCTEIKEENELSQRHEDQLLKLVFIGSLTKNKNVGIILKALSSIQSPSITLDIIGDGPEKERLAHYVLHKGIKNINFRGFLSNKDIPNILNQADILILPSKYDGWGAVVNEALQMGVYVICSEHCGSKTLIVHDKIGFVFKSYQDFLKKLIDITANKKCIKNGREFRKKWSEKISGSILAKYFVDCLVENQKIKIPWKNPNK